MVYSKPANLLSGLGFVRLAGAEPILLAYLDLFKFHGVFPSSIFLIASLVKILIPFLNGCNSWVEPETERQVIYRSVSSQSNKAMEFYVVGKRNLEYDNGGIYTNNWAQRSCQTGKAKPSIIWISPHRVRCRRKFGSDHPLLGICMAHRDTSHPHQSVLPPYFTDIENVSTEFNPTIGTVFLLICMSKATVLIFHPFHSLASQPNLSSMGHLAPLREGSKCSATCLHVRSAFLQGFNMTNIAEDNWYLLPPGRHLSCCIPTCLNYGRSSVLRARSA